jgi:hypothetical protein
VDRKYFTFAAINDHTGRRTTLDIITAIAAGTKALEALKAIQDINKAYDAATWKSKVAELMSDIADMKITLIEANDQIRDLEKNNESLAKMVTFKAEKTISKNGSCYEVFDDGQVSDLPFCQNCMTTGKYVRIAHGVMGAVNAICPGCKTQYNALRLAYRR